LRFATNVVVCLTEFDKPLCDTSANKQPASTDCCDLPESGPRCGCNSWLCEFNEQNWRELAGWPWNQAIQAALVVTERFRA